MSINSIYTLSGISVEYVANGAAYKHMVQAAKYVAKRKAKAGVVVYQWPMGQSTISKKRTRTILCVRGATVDGINMGNVYIKEANL